MSLLGPISDVSVRDCPFRSGSVGTTGRQGRRTAPIENFSQDLRSDLVDGPMTVADVVYTPAPRRERHSDLQKNRAPLRRPRAHVSASVKSWLCESELAAADLLYLFCTCTGAFCRFLPIERIEFSKSFDNLRIVADRLPPPPPKRSNSLEDSRVLVCRSRRLHDVSMNAGRSRLHLPFLSCAPCEFF